MFNPLSIDAPYDAMQFINNLPAYNANTGVDEMIDLIRHIQESGNYYWQGLCFPSGPFTMVPANGTINGSMQVPQGTYVTSITHYLSDGGGGFKMKIFDKGSKASIFYGDYCKEGLVSSDMTQPANPYGGAIPFGPGYVMSPFIINDPGVLGWEIVNLSAGQQLIQVLLSVAVPINKQSSGHKIVDRGY